MVKLFFYSKIYAYYLKRLNNLMNLAPFQKQLKCDQHILSKVCADYTHSTIYIRKNP